MKTFVSSYDLSAPSPYIWGTEGYDRAILLLRVRDRPIEIVSFDHDPRSAYISREEIEQVLLHNFGLTNFVQAKLENVHDAEAGEMPPVSVIVCSRDRPASLKRCLSALTKVDYPSFEVVVVDNGSRTRETADVVAASPFRYVREDRPGLNWARNCGIGTAKYDILAFTDDDVEPDSGWLGGTVLGFANTRIMAVTGLVMPAELQTAAQHYFESYGGMGKGTWVKDFNPAFLTSRQLIRAQDVGVGANMAFRRQLFDSIGLFDTALDVGTPSGGAGDLDMFHRVLAANRWIRYQPGSLVWHYHRRDMETLKLQLYNNGRSYGVYLIKRWREHKLPRRSLIFLVRNWVTWLAWQLLLFRHRLPFALRWAEFRGATHSLWAYWRTYKSDKRIRSQDAISPQAQ